MDAAVVVVGGGPVGSALGLMLPDAMVLDRSEFPRDKACGEGLFPAGARVLEGLGVNLQGEGFPAVRGVRYRLADGSSARADFPSGQGYGVRRWHLDALLAKRAGVRTGVRVTDVADRGDRVEVTTSAGPLVCGRLIAADGINSSVARMLGWWRPSRRPSRFGIVGHLSVPPPSDDIEVSLLGDREVYVAPTACDETLVAVLGARGGLRQPGTTTEASYRQTVALALPGLAEAPLSSRLRGAGPFHLRPRTVAQGRLFLVGDAAGFLDPLTGDALSAGLAQAQALALLLSWDPLHAPARYRTWVRAQRRRRAIISSVAGHLSSSQWLGGRAISGISSRPRALQSLLAANEGSLPLGRIPIRDWTALAGFVRW